MARRIYPRDVPEAEGTVSAPDLTLMKEDAPPREPTGRAVFNGRRDSGRSGEAWRRMPPALPPWYRVDQQTQRWWAAGVCEARVDDWRRLLRPAAGRQAEPRAIIIDGRTLPSSPERGARAGDDGHKQRPGSQGHRGVARLGRRLTRLVTPANQPERAQGEARAEAVQASTDDAVEGALVDEGDPGAQAPPDAAHHGLRLAVVKRPDAISGFVLLPRRWLVERSLGWMARFRRRARHFERLADTLVGWP
ncbi:MAG TPA: transposase [Aggregatilineales bacterium]|nr:transposase [Aggregatilineales bacterium]